MKKKELIDEYINNYFLYLKKAKYFTKKYANFHQKLPKKKEITKNSNNYDKEDNSDIILIISYNGEWKSHIQCRLNENTEEVIKRFFLKLGKSEDDARDIELIVNSYKSLNKSISLKENGLKNNYHIYLISKVYFH